MQYSWVYVTASNKKEAHALGRVLVEKRLCACVNILPQMESLYWWKGKMEKGQESVLIAKTRKTLVPKLISAIKKLHSYDCPCIVELPILSGNPAFLKWITDETCS